MIDKVCVSCGTVHKNLSNSTCTLCGHILSPVGGILSMGPLIFDDPIKAAQAKIVRSKPKEPKKDWTKIHSYRPDLRSA